MHRSNSLPAECENNNANSLRVRCSFIFRVKSGISDPELAWMFENCYPNTLDTAVQAGIVNGNADTFIITGGYFFDVMHFDLAQTWQYLALLKTATVILSGFFKV